MCENEHFLCRFVRDCNDFLVWVFWLWVGFFLKCFAAFFLKCFAAGRGYQDSLFVAALEMLCCGVGYQDWLRPSCAAPAGLTENKES